MSDDIDLIYGRQRPAPGNAPKVSGTLPGQSADLVLLTADRWNRAAQAQSKWSETGKKCVEYFEGRQWSAEHIAKINSEGRAALVINKIRPLVKLVWGFHLTNLTDISYMPGHDGGGTADTAEVLTHVEKSCAERNGMSYVDSEVFLDGILTGRGYFDDRLDFRENDLGELVTRAQDPFATYPDPDAQDYDLNTGNFVFTTRWTSIEEIEYYFGKAASVMLSPWINGGSFTGFPVGPYDVAEEMTPWRRFGGEEDLTNGYWGGYFDNFWDWVDRARKTIRMLFQQHYVRVKRWHFIDLETGDATPVPDHFSGDQVRRLLAYAQSQGAPLIVEPRLTRRLRDTIMIGDIVVFDRWSPYTRMTLTPFFPYFRRGKTRGMVEDLLDPQDEINKRRSARINIISRSSNGGWLIEKGTVGPKEMSQIKIHGAAPGFIMEWDSKEGRGNKPEQITPGVTPVAMAQLEQDSDDDLKDIAGVTDAALGQIEAANASGRAVEARQRQTVVGMEPDVHNWRRTKWLQGRKHLTIFQKHYTEERIIRVRGELRTNPQTVLINQRSAQGIVKNVTLGKYEAIVSETPLSKSFLNGLFNEMLRLKELGMPIPDEWIVNASSMSRKEELIARMEEMRQMQAQGVAVPETEGRGVGDTASAGLEGTGGPVV